MLSEEVWGNAVIPIWKNAYAVIFVNKHSISERYANTGYTTDL